MYDGSVCYALVQQVAQAKGVDQTALAPLHDVVDPDALEALFDDADGSVLADGYVEFTYEGFDVRVDDQRGIELVASDRNGVRE